MDEAHLIDHWGHDFRPNYSQHGKLKDKFKCQVVALTATATESTIRKMITSLHMQNAVIEKLSCIRTNIKMTLYQTHHKQVEILKSVAEFISNQHSSEVGIFYFNTTKECEDAVDYFAIHHPEISCIFYHGGLSNPEKRQNVDLWMSEKVQLICCTCAFGLGINKKNVRFVIRNGMPDSIEQLTQEAGRAGRDGEDSVYSLYFGFNDRKFHLKNASSEDETKNLQLNRLQLVTSFCYNKNTCRQVLLAQHFSEEGKPCNKCDNCERIGEVETEIDMTTHAKLALLTTVELTDTNYNKVTLQDIADALIKKKDNPSTKLSKTNWTSFLQGMIVNNLMREEIRSEQKKGAKNFFVCNNDNEATKSIMSGSTTYFF